MSDACGEVSRTVSSMHEHAVGHRHRATRGVHTTCWCSADTTRHDIHRQLLTVKINEHLAQRSARIRILKPRRPPHPQVQCCSGQLMGWSSKNPEQTGGYDFNIELRGCGGFWLLISIFADRAFFVFSHTPESDFGVLHCEKDCLDHAYTCKLIV